MIVNNHKNVFEYDGSFSCLDCEAKWGAFSGNPKMTEECKVKNKDKVVDLIEDIKGSLTVLQDELKEDKVDPHLVYVGTTLRWDYDGESFDISITKIKDNRAYFTPSLFGGEGTENSYLDIDDTNQIISHTEKYIWLSDPKIKKGQRWKHFTSSIFKVISVLESCIVLEEESEKHTVSPSQQSLLKNYTLLPEEEVTYSVGDWFKLDDGNLWLLMDNFKDGMVTLINSKFDGLWSGWHEVINRDMITQEEFDKITNNDSKDFKRVEIEDIKVKETD